VTPAKYFNTRQSKQQAKLGRSCWGCGWADVLGRLPPKLHPARGCVLRKNSCARKRVDFFFRGWQRNF
jgi:hypothetical protein